MLEILLEKHIGDYKMDGQLLRSSSSYYGNILLLVAFIYISETYHTFYWILWVMYVIVPIVDHILPPSLSNPTPEEEKKIISQKRFLIPIYGFLFMSWITFFWSLDYLYRTEMSYFQFITFALILGNVGIICFIYDHELYHKKGQFGRFIGTIDMIKSLYMHLYSEHVKGHHKWVGTPMDKGTGKYGQSFYEFYPASFISSYTCTWAREIERLKKEGRFKFSFHNRMIIWMTSQILFTYSIYHFYGARVLLFFFMQAFVTITMLEEFNYFTHYGLTRKQHANGEYEPVQPKHSWNAHQLLENLITLGLQRHPDHHANGYRPYQILRAFPDGPTLPCGYLTCLVISFFPPFWYRMTHPILEGYYKDGKATDKQIAQSKNVFFIWIAMQVAFTSAAPYLF